MQKKLKSQLKIFLMNRNSVSSVKFDNIIDNKKIIDAQNHINILENLRETVEEFVSSRDQGDSTPKLGSAAVNNKSIVDIVPVRGIL